MATRLDEATKEAIRKDGEAGMSLQEIANKHQVSWPTAKKFAGGGAPKVVRKHGKKREAHNGNGRANLKAGVAPMQPMLMATPELCDAVWAALPLVKKAALLNHLGETNEAHS